MFDGGQNLFCRARLALGISIPDSHCLYESRPDGNVIGRPTCGLGQSAHGCIELSSALRNGGYSNPVAWIIRSLSGQILVPLDEGFVVSLHNQRTPQQRVSGREVWMRLNDLTKHLFRRHRLSKSKMFVSDPQTRPMIIWIALTERFEIRQREGVSTQLRRGHQQRQVKAARFNEKSKMVIDFLTTMHLPEKSDQHTAVSVILRMPP